MARNFKMREKWIGTMNAIVRFPLTVILLLAAVVMNTLAINQFDNDTFLKLTISFILGAFVYTVFQLIYERTDMKPVWRYLFIGISIVTSALYYFLIINSDWSVEITLRTTVVFFILLVLFLWVPAVKSRIDFNQTFMAAFKGFFTAVFFNGVLFLGIVLVFGATDMLLFSVDEKAYIHAANIIFIFLAPIHFLSQIPYYPGRNELEAAVLPVVEDEAADNVTINEEKAKKEEVFHKQITPARFLEALISYVIIPISAVFTIILLLYIITNITGEFWTDNLMEPLLVIYSIVVIIVYLLASTINNVFTRCFRMIFPKVLVPVVLFQTAASVLKIGDTGITYGRYYVIMFGLFATVAGIIFCFLPVRNNGLIAPILIVLSVISILPVIDAFSLSKANQTERLVSTLERNGMLKDGMLKPASDLSDKDKQVIISAVNYLNNMQYTKDIKWLQGYNQTYDFEAAFGFPQYGNSNTNSIYVSIMRDQSEPIPVTGYDFVQRMIIYSNNLNDMQPFDFEMNGKDYSLYVKASSKYNQVIILEENGIEINRMAMKDVFSKFDDTTDKTLVPTKELTFKQENDESAITVIADSININIWNNNRDEQAEVNILVKIK